MIADFAGKCKHFFAIFSFFYFDIDIQSRQRYNNRKTCERVYPMIDTYSVPLTTLVKHFNLEVAFAVGAESGIYIPYGHTCFSVSTGCSREGDITVSSLHEGEYGISDVCLSVMCIVNNEGIKTTLTPALTAEEEEKLLQGINEALAAQIASEFGETEQKEEKKQEKY